MDGSQNNIFIKVFKSFKNGLDSSKSKAAHERLGLYGIDKKKAQIGYHSGQFHHRNSLSLAEIEECLEEKLLERFEKKVPNAKENTYIVRGKHSLAFPLLDEEAEITNFYFDGLTKDFGIFLNERGFYPKYPNEFAKHIILTENIVDAASAIQHSHIKENFSILALWGLERFPQQIKDIIKEHQNLEEITFLIEPSEVKHSKILQYVEELKLLNSNIIFSLAETPNVALYQYLKENEALAFSALISKRKGLIYKITNFDTSMPDRITANYRDLEFMAIGTSKLLDASNLQLTLKLTYKNHTYREKVNLSSSHNISRFSEYMRIETQLPQEEIEHAIHTFADRLEEHILSKNIVSRPETVEIGEARRLKAEGFLKSDGLLENIVSVANRSGIIADQKHIQTLYIAFCSRLMQKPLSINYISKDAALPSQIAGLFRPNMYMDASSVSENSLYYFQNGELDQKVLLMEASKQKNTKLPLGDMLSKGKISKITTYKDKEGSIRSKFIEVSTSSSFCISSHLPLLEKNIIKNCIQLFQEETPELQRQKIKYQQQLASNEIDIPTQEAELQLLKDIQLLFRPIKVVNPFAHQLSIPEGLKNRVDSNQLYLNFISAVAFLHQFQREETVDETTGEVCILVGEEDIRTTNSLLKESILDSSHILTKPTRIFFEKLKKYLNKESKNSFYLKEISLETHIPNSTIKRYVAELKNHNLLQVKGGNRYKNGFLYELTDRDLSSGESGLNTFFEKKYN